MFIAALLTIVKRQKQPKRSSMYEQIKKIWYIHTNIGLKKGNPVAYYNMDETENITKWNIDNSLTKGQILYDFTYMRYIK